MTPTKEQYEKASGLLLGWESIDSQTIAQALADEAERVAFPLEAHIAELKAEIASLKKETDRLATEVVRASSRRSEDEYCEGPGGGISSYPHGNHK